MADHDYLSSIEDIIEDARNGRMFILLDDEDRENEGDLVIPAQMATPDAINFMATHGRGLICLSLTAERVKHLGLHLMVHENESRHQTAFTVSIEAKDGITTGISASDRARTIAAAIDPTKGPDDISSPGHVFPLMAREGGVLVRTGHTEAAVDISRLAGLNPGGVICEIMKDDGTMARMPDLIAFAQRHGLKLATIADLIAYRLRNDRIVKPGLTTTFETHDAGDFRAIVYQNTVDGTEHLALVKGDPSTPEPVLVRMHQFSILEAVYSPARYFELYKAMRMIEEEGRGVIVMIRDPSQAVLTEQIMANMENREGPRQPLRSYGTGAQILLDLGVREMVVLTNAPRPIVGLEGYGLSVLERRPIDVDNLNQQPIRIRANER